ncbi:unnamed protein product [Agarophyton chilense]|eukprot:gb/GEZJ01000926.1/.p1 GENE.gb/GEZJ01000926.1/~~gb/GEZJ01000926.1/.p1  ORF type:complete len:1271 (+),score=217.77 gb/GEZJ01000926.1/:208-4020(+)
MEPNDAPLDMKSQSLPSATVALQPALFVHPPAADDFNLTALDNLPRNVAGLQSYSDFVKAACKSLPAGNIAHQPDDDRNKSICIRGHPFRFVGVPICDSECSYQSDITISSGQGAEESLGPDEAPISAPVPAWTPTASPAKSILRRSSHAPLPPSQPSPKPLVFDYASSASPASRRMSSVSLCASSKRASAQKRRLSFDTGVQVQEPVETTEAEYRKASVSARKIRSRRSSMSSRRLSSTSTCRPATYAGFEPSGLTDAGALLCETNGRKFLLVVDDVEPEEQVGTQCQPLDIDVEMDLLFEKMDEAEDDDESIMEVEHMRSAAVPPGSQYVGHGDLVSIKTVAEGVQSHVAPNFTPLISLTDLPSTPGPYSNRSARCSNAPSEPRAIASQIHTESGTCPIQPLTQNSLGTPSKSVGTNSLSTVKEDNVDRESIKGTPPPASPTCQSDLNEQNESVNDESMEHETESDHCASQRKYDLQNESLDHKMANTSQGEEQADDAVTTGKDLENEEEIVATTAHATRTRSSHKRPPVARLISATPSKSIGIVEVPDTSVDSNHASIPDIQKDVLVEILQESEHPESEVFDSTPINLDQPPPEAHPVDNSDNSDAQVEKQKVAEPVSAPENDPAEVLVETTEVADSVAVQLPASSGDKSDSSTQATVPSSGVGNAEFVTQEWAAISITPASSHVKNDGEYRSEKSPKTAPAHHGTEGDLRAHEASNMRGAGIRLCTNVSQINIEPKVTAYQLAVLQTLTPNTKTALAKIRGNKGPFVVEGVRVSPVNSAATHRQRTKVVSEVVRNVQNHERGTSISRSARDHNSSRAEPHLQLEQSSAHSKSKENANDLENKQRLPHGRLEAETKDRSIQVSGVHCSLDVPSGRLQNCCTADNNLLASPEPRQPEMLMRASIDNVPGTPIEFKKSQMKLGGVEELFDHADQLQDIKLASSVDFAGLISPAPLARQMVLDKKEFANIDAEDSDGNLEAVSVRRMTTRSTSRSTARRTTSSRKTKSVEQNQSVKNDNESKHEEEIGKDSLAAEFPPTQHTRKSGEADFVAHCEQNIDECDGPEDFEDHGDEDFDNDHHGCFEQEDDLEDGNLEISGVEAPVEPLKERSKKLSVSSSRKRHAQGDILSSETMYEPLKHSNCKEDDSQVQPSPSSPPPTEMPSSETSSPVIRRNPNRASKRKKVSRKAQASKDKKKRQWRELAHLPVDDVRIEEGAGPRRSKRQRFPRLKYWKNEVVSYERRTSQIMPTVAEVLVDVGETDSEEAWMPRW